MSKAFNELFVQHAGAAMVKQLAFLDLVGERDWIVDWSSEQVRFGDDLAFSIQLLGTEEHGEWLWTWGDQVNQFEAGMLRSCLSLKRYGEQHGIAEFVDASFPTSVADGTLLSSIASGRDRTACYYRAPYEGGALFFLIENALGPDLWVGPARIGTLLASMAHLHERYLAFDQRAMVRSMLDFCGYDFIESETALTAHPRPHKLAEPPACAIKVGFDSASAVREVEIVPENEGR
ncbi:DUF6882 domain-containing protein [Pseudomarimonas arenosa]|uniref:Uncharacterized protein n=1 Tax=Pseudomarimonas arenosa TaxID=2774145 RepID=A0AAW3ZLV4_9GAMM|nr:DUF6882 domain-containing protein [Pseudomarimonas arenosa]MBD8526948.1 hypothetical protein [Pseudomarimonas arenosa]